MPVGVPKEERPFCPRTMVRYDNCVTEYTTTWVCKMCLKVVLNAEAIPIHIENCVSGVNKMLKSEVPDKSITEDSKYICDTCNRVFSRKVTLKKHQEMHNSKFSSDFGLGESDDEMIPDEQIESKQSDDKMFEPEKLDLVTL
jgi:transposase-like protein